jgi:ketosteroid isomerase-like protein
MILRISLLTAFLALAAVALLSSEGQFTTSRATPNPEKAVQARLDEIQRAAEALDAEKVFSFVLDNERGALVQNGKLFLTRKEALDSTREGFRGVEKVEYRFEQQQVTLLSPTVALATGEGVSSATATSGKNFSTRFAQSVVLLLTNGEWKVFHAHRSFPRNQ